MRTRGQVEFQCRLGLTGKIIQIRKAENDPKKAITFPNPGNAIAVPTQMAVVPTLEMIL